VTWLVALAVLSGDVEFEIERVVPIVQFQGEAIVTAVDPRFVVVAKVVWTEKPELLPLHARRAFAVHSPSRLGLNGWTRGSTICWRLTKTTRDGTTTWRIDALKPDAGCRGGG
jgi:hypothetical protein